MSFWTQRPEKQVLREAQGKRQLDLERVVADAIEPLPAYNEFNTFIEIPSARLSCTLELFWDRIRLTNANQLPFLITNGVGTYLETVSNTAALIARTTPISRSPDNPLYVNVQGGLLHNITGSTAVQLPFAYELSTGLRRVQIAWTLQAPVVNGNPIFLSWAVRARFEPNVPMDDEELQNLFSQCRIT